MKSFVLLLGLLLPSAACAQSFTIDWYKCAGGGGTSTGGVYAVTGTIGQQDAGAPLTGDSYSLQGGFWGVISVVQTVGTPLLEVAHAGSNVVISWRYPSTGFRLEQNSSAGTTNWTPSIFTFATNNLLNSVTIPAPAGNLFFRLKAP